MCNALKNVVKGDRKFFVASGAVKILIRCRTVARESSIGGLDILKIDKTQLVDCVPYFNFGVLSPPPSPMAMGLIRWPRVAITKFRYLN